LKIAIYEPKFLTPKAHASSHVVLLKNQVEYWAKAGVEVVILTESGTTIERNNLIIYPIQGLFYPRNWQSSLNDQSIPTYSGYVSPDLIPTVIRMLNRKIQADVIYTCGTSFSGVFSAILGLMTGIPTVHYVFHHIQSWRWWRGDVDALEGYKVPFRHVAGQFLRDAPREVLRRDFLTKLALRRINRIITSSKYVKNAVCKLGLDAENISVVYPGIEIPHLNGEFRGAETPLVTYFGNLWQGRGVLDLLEAFPRIIRNFPKAKLVVAASNVNPLTKRHFKQIIGKYNLGPNIEEKGLVNDVYSELLLPATVIVLPYRDFPSIKLIESMAAAKPVVTTPLQWIPELISDGSSGLLVNVGDINGIAKKIADVLGDPIFAEIIGNNARRIIEEKCNLCGNAEATLNIIRDAAHEGIKD